MDLASTKKQLAGPSVDSNQGSDGEHSTLSNDHSESSPDEENSTSEDDEGTDSSDDNSDSDADSSSGVRTPELKAHYETNHHRPLSPTKPTPEAGGTKEDETKQEGEKHEEEGDKLDIETIKTQAAKSCEIGKEASRIFHEWGRFEILGRLRDRNVNGPFTEDELVERIWVKDGLQQRWRIYIQTLPFGIGHANRCGLGDCRKKWASDETSSTIIISFEPAQWTQNAKLMETRLEILDSVYEYASLKCDNYEPGKHLDVWNSDVPFNIKETKLDAMENSILDIETHRLPRWEGDDWDELWEPDYVLLGTKFLNDRYGEGKKYCIRCFESLLPPVHSPKPQRKDDDKADVATEKSQKVQSNENTKRQTFQSSNNPTAPTAENKGSSPSSPAPLDQTEPLSLAEAAGDPTINPWLGVYSSVFPDTRGRYALNENIHEMIWLWKDACCGIEITVGEAGEDDDYAEEKEKMKELGKMGLREVLWLTPESWK
ncbi:hypothetical protein EX30DRAFT_337994 [Ascodesmis nigricans]|uniref:Uncharacterized protein n=1 Tax=Ascodesmis nigricans TaxID=341454 RepID=A0A4S2N8N3_9PEZI|nr:hypothetical protein EX30DRAFT_337994 [Ascodesmis nigricans]